MEKFLIMSLIICFIIIVVLIIAYIINSIQLSIIEKHLSDIDNYFIHKSFKEYKKSGINSLIEEYKNCEEYLIAHNFLCSYYYTENLLLHYLFLNERDNVKSMYYYNKGLKCLIEQYLKNKKIKENDYV